MEEYIEKGELLVQSNYANSLACELENCIIDRTLIESKFETSERVKLSSFSCFTALAAPSMEGKTQLAFQFRRLKPLYFSLSVLEKKDRSQQNIYRNFADLSSALYSFASSDCTALKECGIFIPPTATALKSSSIPLHTLGFLKALAEQSATQPIDKNWMRFHSRRQGFTFTPISVQQLLDSFDFEGFVLFLDEYNDVKENNYIRNLSRTVNLYVIVANTNTKITNIVGLNNASATTAYNIWSDVVCKMDAPSVYFLDEVYGLQQSLSVLTANRPESDPVCIFLTNFVQVQLKHLRPGVAVYVAEILKDFCIHFAVRQPFTLGQLLQFVCEKLSTKLSHRKIELNYDKAMMGHIALLLPESYREEAIRGELARVLLTDEQMSSLVASLVGDDDRLDEELLARLGACEFIINLTIERGAVAVNYRIINPWRQARFIESHLFYLHNPVQSGLAEFATFPPTKENDPLNVLKNSVLTPWAIPTSEFDPLEFFTIAASLFMPWPASASRLLLNANAYLKSRGGSVSETTNLVAASLPGNAFEVSAAVCTVRSSHYTYHPSETEKFAFSLAGQRGDIFVSNVISELCYSNTRFIVEFPAELLHLLAHVRIPFLYSIGQGGTYFEDLAGHVDDHFFVRPYLRTTNASQVDGKFDAILTANGSNLLFNICSECKNWAKIIDSPELLKILIKTGLQGAFISLVFCTAFVSCPRKTSKLYKYCLDSGINVYRLERTGELMELVPFFAGMPMRNFPYRICIVLESFRINQIRLMA